MFRKMIKKILAFALVYAMIIVSMPVTFSNPVFAATDYYDSKVPSGAIAAKNKKLIKKLKKNAWSSSPNPDSAEITSGYAMYKLYTVVKKYIYDDYDFKEDDYWENMTKAEKQGMIPDTIKASTKTQKKAIKWLCQHHVLHGVYFDFYWYDEKTENDVFDGTVKIKRYQLVSLLTGIINRFYPFVLEDIPTNTTWDVAKDDWRMTFSSAIYKGIIVGDNLDLNAYATKEDLSRAIKNLRTVIKYRIPLVYRETPLTSTRKTLDAEIQEIASYLKDKGIYAEVTEDGDRIEIYGKGMTGDSRIQNHINNSLEAHTGRINWTIGLEFDVYRDSTDIADWFISGKTIDVVETIKRIVEIRLRY